MSHWLGSLNVQLVRIMHFTDTYLPRRDGVITSLRTLRAGLADAGHTSITVVPAHREKKGEPGLVRIPALPCGIADLHRRESQGECGPAHTVAFAAAMLDVYGKFVPCGRTRRATPARADAAHSAA